MAQTKLKTQAFADSAVSTPKIADLAVTFGKQSSKPFFIATYSGAIAPANDVVWGNEIADNLGNYNHTNGIFTAPVAGVYIFGFNILLPNANTGEFRLEFYKNGSIYDAYIKHKPTASTWQTMHGTVIAVMNAGDTMKIRYTTGSDNLYSDANYNRFWGIQLA